MATKLTLTHYNNKSRHMDNMPHYGTWQYTRSRSGNIVQAWESNFLCNMNEESANVSANVGHFTQSQNRSNKNK